MTDSVATFLEATVRTATPLAFAALGETVSERAGVINIGLEGSVIAGAFAATAAALASGVVAGFAAGAAAGALVALLVALVVVGLRADQIITGTAATLLALGLTGTLFRILYGSQGVALAVPTLAPLPVPGLASIPVVGHALFAQPLPTYVLYLLVPLVWWWLYRTHDGLALRAVGEMPPARPASRRGAPACGRSCSAGAWAACAGRRSSSRRSGRSRKGCRQGGGSSRSRSSPWAAGARCGWRSRRSSSARPARGSTFSRRWAGTCRISSFSRCPTS